MTSTTSARGLLAAGLPFYLGISTGNNLLVAQEHQLVPEHTIVHVWNRARDFYFYSVALPVSWNIFTYRLYGNNPFYPGMILWNHLLPFLHEWWGTGVAICLERGADLHMAQLMPLPLTVSCFSEIQIGFTFLVLAHPGSPGKRAVKRVCVCVCVCYFLFFKLCHPQMLKIGLSNSMTELMYAYTYIQMV